MMVDSWYDKGERLSNNDPMIQWIVESWYDNGMRLTPEEVPAPAAEEAPAEEEAPAAEVQAPLPAGMSAAAAARSPKLAAAALKSEAEIAEIQARLDTFPTKAGTMYTILTGKLKIAQSGLAGIIDQAREAVQAVADEEDLGLMQRVEALQKEMAEVAAAVESSKVEALQKEMAEVAAAVES